MMATFDTRLLGGLLLLFPSTVAFTESEAVLDVRYETATSGYVLTAELRGATGPAFAVVLQAPDDAGHPQHAPIVAAGPLDPTGHGVAAVPFDGAFLDKLEGELVLRAGYLVGQSIEFTEPADLGIGGGTPLGCELLDFDFAQGADDLMVAGETIDTQFEAIGLSIFARNNHPAHPDRSILFDTGNPTGGDTDLATPNPAAFGNDEPLGQALIVAENDVDADSDGLVDVPDDEAFGGSLVFDFEEPTIICSATLIDIDELPGTELRFFRNGNLAVPDEVMPIASLGNGSVQKVTVLEPDVDRLEIFLRGSGGIPMLEIIPCPRMIDFNESPTGIPLDLQAGEHITNQLAASGMTVDAVNFSGGGGEPGQNHPDKAILFDTGNLTGDDTDLITPQPGVPGNDEPLGLVMIIAEDDIDANLDGLVDDPDDEFAGGELRLSFDQAVTIESAVVQDVDGVEQTFLRLFDDVGFEIAAIQIPPGADGNVQTVVADVSGVHTAVLALGGSGSLAELRFCPDPEPPLE